jgi:hypothetical protein
VKLSELAEMMDLAEMTVWRWYKKGYIPGFKLGPRSLWFNPEDVWEALYERLGNSFAWKQSPPERPRRRRVNEQPRARRKQVPAPATTNGTGPPSQRVNG